MGKRKSNRRKTRRARRGESSGKSTEAIVSLPLSNRLRNLGLELESAYATCVTVTLALQTQDADEDGRIETCLRTSVCDPLGRVSEALHDASERLQPGDAS